jgi:solute:Na+ symporter, SSS family
VSREGQPAKPFALLTKPTDEPILARFYETVQPAGAWGRVKASALSANPEFRREAPFARDALVAICALYVGTLYLILHRYGVAFACFGTTLTIAVVLFFTWYRNLPAPEQTQTEEERSSPRRE